MKSWSKMSDIERKEQLDELCKETEKKLKICPACGNESIEVDKDNREVVCNHCKNEKMMIKGDGYSMAEIVTKY